MPYSVDDLISSSMSVDATVLAVESELALMRTTGKKGYELRMKYARGVVDMNLTSTMLSIMPILMEEGEKSAASGTACNSCDDACGCITIPKAVRMAKDRGLLPSDLSGPCILDKGVPGWILSARQSLIRFIAWGPPPESHGPSQWFEDEDSEGGEWETDDEEMEN